MKFSDGTGERSSFSNRLGRTTCSGSGGNGENGSRGGEPSEPTTPHTLAPPTSPASPTTTRTARLYSTSEAAVEAKPFSVLLTRHAGRFLSATIGVALFLLVFIVFSSFSGSTNGEMSIKKTSTAATRREVSSIAISSLSSPPQEDHALQEDTQQHSRMQTAKEDDKEGNEEALGPISPHEAFRAVAPLSRNALGRLLAAGGMAGGDDAAMIAAMSTGPDFHIPQRATSSTAALEVSALLASERAIVADIADAIQRGEFHAHATRAPAVVCGATIPVMTSSTTTTTGINTAPPPFVVIIAISGRLFQLPDDMEAAMTALRVPARFYATADLRALLAGLGATPPELVAQGIAANNPQGHNHTTEEDDEDGTEGELYTVESTTRSVANPHRHGPHGRWVAVRYSYRPRTTCLYVHQRDEMSATIVLHQLLLQHPSLLILAGSVMTSPLRLRVVGPPTVTNAVYIAASSTSAGEEPARLLDRVRYVPDPRCRNNSKKNTTEGTGLPCRVTVAVEAVPGRMPHPRILPIPDYHHVFISGEKRRLSHAEASTRAFARLKDLRLPLRVDADFQTTETFNQNGKEGGAAVRGESGRDPLLQFRGSTNGFGPLAVAQQWAAPRDYRSLGLQTTGSIAEREDGKVGRSISGGPLWDWAETDLLAAALAGTTPAATADASVGRNFAPQPPTVTLAELIAGSAAAADPTLPRPLPPPVLPGVGSAKASLTLPLGGFRYSDRCRAVASLRCGMERLRAADLVDRLHHTLQTLIQWNALARTPLATQGPSQGGGGGEAAASTATTGAAAPPEAVPHTFDAVNNKLQEPPEAVRRALHSIFTTANTLFLDPPRDHEEAKGNNSSNHQHHDSPYRLLVKSPPVVGFAVHARRFALRDAENGYRCPAHEGHWAIGQRLLHVLRPWALDGSPREEGHHFYKGDDHPLSHRNPSGFTSANRSQPQAPVGTSAASRSNVFDARLTSLLQDGVPHASLLGRFEATAAAAGPSLWDRLQSAWRMVTRALMGSIVGAKTSAAATRAPQTDLHTNSKQDRKVEEDGEEGPATSCERHYAVLHRALQQALSAIQKHMHNKKNTLINGDKNSSNKFSIDTNNHIFHSDHRNNNNINNNNQPKEHLQRHGDKKKKKDATKKMASSTDFQLDIDGNSNSWDGLRWKLCSLKPTLKVRSSSGFVQWYYGSLRDGHNVALLPAAHRAAEDARRHLTSRNASAWAAMAANARLLCQRTFSKGATEHYLFDTVARAWSHHVPMAAGYDPALVLAAYITGTAHPFPHSQSELNVDAAPSSPATHGPRRRCRGHVAVVADGDPQALQAFPTVNALFDFWNNNLADTGCGRSYAIS